MSLVFDASVVIKWFVPENLSAEAMLLLDGVPIVQAPDLVIVETGNIVWKKRRNGEIAGEQASAIVQRIRDSIPILYPAAEMIDRALAIALALDHPVYDCLYIACAEAADGLLVTADGRLHVRTRRSPFHDRVRHLGDAAAILDEVGGGR